MQRMKEWFPGLLLCVFVFCGCMTTGSKCLLTVSNSGDNPITDVALELGGVVKYSTPVVEPHSDAVYKPLREGMSVSPKLSWKNKDGSLASKEVKLTKPLPANFRGRILFQIDSASDVRMFLMPNEDDGASSIPWGNSGNWDGTVLMPGMNPQ